MALTPKPEEALLAAHGAQDGTLNRCRGGWYDRSQHPSPAGGLVITSRTANALVDMGLAEYDNPYIPSALYITHDGIAQAQAILGDA